MQQLEFVLTLTEAPRIEKLKLFMRMQKPPLSFVSLSKQLGISSAALGRHCANDTMPVNQHSHLIDKGIPENLLPKPEDRKPGPKPKIVTDAPTAA